MLQPFKQLARAIIPAPLLARINHVRAKAKYGHLGSREIFEKVYADGHWGRDSDGMPISGTGSHDEEIVGPYVEKISAFLRSLGNPVVVDLGCGDFNVGSRIAPYAQKYIACDVSATILDIAVNKYPLSNVEFRNLDLVEGKLPVGDVCLVRQVLQHLGNKDIQSFVAELHERKPYKYLVVTEHVPFGARFRPNADKATGPGLRLNIGSGVDLASAPFLLRHSGSEELLCLRQDTGGRPACITTTMYRL